jgi:hypothetical protein
VLVVSFSVRVRVSCEWLKCVRVLVVSVSVRVSVSVSCEC